MSFIIAEYWKHTSNKENRWLIVCYLYDEILCDDERQSYNSIRKYLWCNVKWKKWYKITYQVWSQVCKPICVEEKESTVYVSFLHSSPVYKFSTMTLYPFIIKKNPLKKKSLVSQKPILRTYEFTSKLLGAA